MTPDTTLDPAREPIPIQPAPTTGMTTKVVKGSIWTLGGSVLPLMVSFVATPFIIRFLGAEAYGVLLLVGLIPTYFSFADFGMGVASTKFEAEAYADADSDKEGKIVRAAAVIALVSSGIVALPLFILSNPIVAALNVPDYLQSEASIALKFTSVAFVIGILSSVFNSPMLARLRMDLNTFTGAVPKVLMAIVTPVILYLGGGIVGAVSWSLLISILTCLCVGYFSYRLLPTLFVPRITSGVFRPLMKFGGSLVLAGIAAMLLVNLEKMILTKLVSVKALAYYSVAFTFANMATIFSGAMVQSLVPAFSQLQSSDRRPELRALFSRGTRLNLIVLLPALTIMCLAAKPFFTIWAGAEFGVESTTPLYILLSGLFFNILAFIPYSSIVASGRTDLFAKLYWLELFLYAILAFVMISYFGIIGAASAWSIRVAFDAILVGLIARKVAFVDFDLSDNLKILLLGIASFAPPILFIFFVGNYSMWLFILATLSLVIYALLTWTFFIDLDERRWLKSRFPLRLIYER